MRLTTYVSSLNELVEAKECGIDDVLLEPSALAIQGSLSAAETQGLAREARKIGLCPILNWDRLHLDAELDRAVSFLKELDLTLFSAVRVQDPGAIEILLDWKNAPPLQLILKAGNHNVLAIQAWIEQCAGKVERVILSSEIPKTRLEEYARTLPVKIEILGFGPILLFYSPRKLLSYPLKRELSDESLENHPEFLLASADCEDTQHKGFRVIETSHGTVMYHAKDYNLLMQSQELRGLGMGSFLIDMRLCDQKKWLPTVSALVRRGSENEVVRFLNEYPVKTTYCFYAANATDVLFKKLKNRQTQRRDEAFVGEIVESLKGQHLLIRMQNRTGGIRVGEHFSVVTPFGKTIEIEAWELKDLEGERVSEVGPGDFAVLPFYAEIPPTSAVYRKVL